MFDNIPTNYHVKLSKIMEPLKLTLLNPEVDMDKVEIRQSDVNRPALQLAGFLSILTLNVCRSWAWWKVLMLK